MIDAAHQQLGRANLVLVWDNDTAHRDAAMKKLIAERPWLTVFYLPAYTPTLNPVEIALPQCGLRRSRCA